MERKEGSQRSDWKYSKLLKRKASSLLTTDILSFKLTPNTLTSLPSLLRFAIFYGSVVNFIIMKQLLS